MGRFQTPDLRVLAFEIYEIYEKNLPLVGLALRVRLGRGLLQPQEQHHRLHGRGRAGVRCAPAGTSSLVSQGAAEKAPCVLCQCLEPGPSPLPLLRLLRSAAYPGGSRQVSSGWLLCTKALWQTCDLTQFGSQDPIGTHV